MVENLVRRARRRFLLNETLAQFSFAAAVSVAGFVLVLIFGTRYLEWWTLGIFAAAGIAIGSWRIYLRTPDRYTTAVRLDENAHLQDTLSTALYFSDQMHSSDHGAGSGEFRQSQREQAEGAAGDVHLERAVPFLVPRSLYAMAALCVLASGLVALRYGIGHGLDLRAPITQFLFEDEAIRDAKKAQALYPKQNWMQEAQSLLSKLGLGPDPKEPSPSDPDALDKAIEQALQSPGDPSGKSEKGAGSAKDGQTKAGDASNDQPDGDPIDNGEQQASNDQNASEGANPKTGDKGSKSTSGKNGSPNNRESLLSRLKDAVSNMLSKSGKDEESSSQKNQQAKNETPSGEKGQSGKGAQEKGESQSDADGEPDSDGQSGQQAQGRLNSPANQTPAQGGSGIGNQDGSKEIKAAAQLKAMGKISEIIGQRAATVSGETSVEVQSGNQKLHTDYSNTSAAHVETEGDVTRDEIPLGLQAYVQQYFAEVRKAGGAGKKTGSKQ
jgi:hypothetical protein